MFQLASDLPSQEYSAWIDESSCLQQVVLFNPSIDSALLSPWPWFSLVVWSVVNLALTPWSALIIIEKVLVAVISASSVVLVDTMGRKFPKPPWMSTAVHFLLVGASKKFKKVSPFVTPIVFLLPSLIRTQQSCWAPKTIPTLAIAVALAYMNEGLAVLALAALWFYEGRALEAISSPSYIPPSPLF